MDTPGAIQLASALMSTVACIILTVISRGIAESRPLAARDWDVGIELNLAGFFMCVGVISSHMLDCIGAGIEINLSGREAKYFFLAVLAFSMMIGVIRSTQNAYWRGGEWTVGAAIRNNLMGGLVLLGALALL